MATGTIKSNGLKGIEVIKAGTVSTTGNNVAANTQYTFQVLDDEIKESDIILTQLLIKGTTTAGITPQRSFCSDKSALIFFLSSVSYNASQTIGFYYVILRIH